MELAEVIARIAHVGQYTKSDHLPYWRHCQAVADGCPSHLRAAGWLHDVLEDTEVTTSELLVCGVEPLIVRVVIKLTRTLDESYEEYILRVAQMPEAVTVKLADLAHNLRPGCPGELRQRYLKAQARLRLA